MLCLPTNTDKQSIWHILLYYEWMQSVFIFFFFTSPVVKGTLTGAQETSAELGSTSSHEGPVPLDVGII